MLRYIEVINSVSRLIVIHSMAPQWPPLGMMRVRRFFEKGALRFVILDLLAKKPAHGYEVIRALEDRFHGLYSPSPGSIYPTLQLLQDQGYVTSVENEGKKIYTITDSGRSYLAKHAELVEGLQPQTENQDHSWLHAEFRETAGELRRLGQLFMQRAPQLTRGQVRQIHEIIMRAAAEIEAIIKKT